MTHHTYYFVTYNLTLRRTERVTFTYDYDVQMNYTF